MLTRVFKSGNSLALRIPKELAIFQASEEVEIAHVGNTLVVQPARRESLADLAEVLAGFPPGFMAEGRDTQEQEERLWNTLPKGE